MIAIGLLLREAPDRVTDLKIRNLELKNSHTARRSTCAIDSHSSLVSYNLQGDKIMLYSAANPHTSDQ